MRIPSPFVTRANAGVALLCATVMAFAAPAVLEAQGRGNLTQAERLRMQREAEAAFQAEMTMERPIPALNTIWMEEMTWIEIRDAMADGKRTAIVSTGGIEQNGPYVALGKHNYVLEGACEGIARALGDALCAPIIKLVPEGGFEPKTGHMRYPGTITVRDETFEAMLEDVGRSLHVHGFDWIIYIGDSGGNQTGMSNVASRLNAEWGQTKALFVGEFYDNAGVQQHMRETFGITEEDSDGWHDTFWLTAMQAAVDPETVRFEQRVQADRAHINGVSIVPLGRTISIGEELTRWRIEKTVGVIQQMKADAR